jgi:peptidoglycan/xylan/chitin deacetylase (PgdA/CDA1 family)
MAAIFVAGAAGLAVIMTTEQASIRHVEGTVMNTPKPIPEQAVVSVSPPPPTPLVYQPVAPLLPAPQSGLAGVTYRVPTSEPVIFITIDDGVYPSEAALWLMQSHRAVASLFLNDASIRTHYDYFKRWQAAGSTIQNHTVDHTMLTKLPLASQKTEICDNASRFERAFGARPTLFRPPYGEFNTATRQAASDCGEHHVVHWSVSGNGGLHYQTGNRLRPGDIVLLHFTPTLDKELVTVFAAAKEQNLQIGRLEDWLR